MADQDEKTFTVGTVVSTEKGPGKVSFYGPTAFASGKWVGVVLDKGNGKNNGNVQGKQYFTCPENHGIFVRPGQVMESGKSASKMSAPSTGIKAPATPKPKGAMKEPSTPREMSKSSSKPGSKITTPRMTPAHSSEKIKPSPSVEKLGPSLSRSSSGSSDLANKESSMKVPKSASKLSTPAAKKPGGEATPQPKSNPQPETIETRRGSVANKIQMMQEKNLEKNSDAIMSDKLSEGAELEYLRAESKDLMEKLETLRAKRLEDKQKLTDYERCKIQLQQLLEYKTLMAEQHSELQKQLICAQKDAREAIEAHSATEEDTGDLNVALEMATLDKEMAEEKAEILQTELELTKETLTEVQVELELLQSEIRGETNSGDGKVNDAIQLKQLQHQNEKLREALVKMRDLSAAGQADHQRLAKENESMKNDIQEMQRKSDSLTTINTTYETHIQDLKEQVDAALGAEEMVEQLTSKNLGQEEKIRLLEDAVDDLEQLRGMDEELQEDSREKEKGLREELDIGAGKISELKLQLTQAAKQATDYENTIKKFRQRVADLQEEIEDMKDQLKAAENNNADKQANEEGTVANLPAIKAARSFAEGVENEMCRIDLNNCTQHIKYLKSFLPDNFSKPGGDNDSVSLTLLFPRLVAKAELLMSFLQEKYPMAPGGMRREHVTKSHKGEQWGFAAKMNSYLCGLVTILHRFDGAIQRCSIERQARLAHLAPEMSAQERMIDSYFELLKTNRLDENTQMEVVHKAINYFQNVYSVHMSSEDFNGTDFMLDSIKQILAATSWFRTDIQRIRFYLVGSEEGALVKNLNDFEVFVSDTEQFCVRIRNGLPKDSKPTPFAIDSEVVERFCEAVGNLNTAAEIVDAACNAASAQVSMLPDVQGLEQSRLIDHFAMGAEKIHGRLNDKNPEDLVNMALGMSLAAMSKVSQSMEEGKLTQPLDAEGAQAPFPPLLERAHTRKEDAVEADGLRWQISKKDNEIMDVKKTLRMRTEEISELKVRLDMGEKRLSSSGKEGDEKQVRLQHKVDQLSHDLSKKEKEFNDTMDSMYVAKEATEQENVKLKENLRTMSKKILIDNVKNVTLPSSPVSTPTMQSSMSNVGGMMKESPLLLQQIDVLKAALSASQATQWHSQSDKMRKTLASLKPLRVPKKIVGLETQTGLVDLDQLTAKKTDDLSQLMRETHRLQKEYTSYIGNLKIPDLTNAPKGGEHILVKNTPAAQVNRMAMERVRLANWAKDLNIRMQQQRVSNLSGAKAPSQFANFPAPAFTKSQGDSEIVARLRLPPVDPKDAGKTVCVSVTSEQFASLHRDLVMY